MSKILVIGTSLSDGSCKKEDGTERIDIKDRWQHLIGLEVETLARSGVSPTTILCVMALSFRSQRSTLGLCNS